MNLRVNHLLIQTAHYRRGENNIANGTQPYDQEFDFQMDSSKTIT